jgi:hypothetical protein
MIAGIPPLSDQDRVTSVIIRFVSRPSRKMANSRFFGFAQDGEGGVPGTFYLQEKGSRSLSGIAFSPKPIQRFAGLMFDPGTRGQSSCWWLTASLLCGFG